MNICILAQDCELCLSIKVQVLLKCKLGLLLIVCAVAMFFVSVKLLENLNFFSVILQQIYLSFYFMNTFKKQDCYSKYDLSFLLQRSEM